MKKIVCISGTSRPDNYTSRALAVVVDELSARGASPEVFDARELTLKFPGEPPTDDAKRLTQAIEDAVGVILATPEYHGSFCAMTKLVIENLGFPSKLSGKPMGLLGVAAGRIGAIKSLEMLRGVCAHTGAIVLPRAISIAGVRGAFDGDRCTDGGTEEALRSLAESMTSFLSDYVCPKMILEAEARRGDGTPWATSV